MSERKPRDTRSGAGFARKYGPWALVTGAAQGLGAAFCDALAGRGLNVVLLDVQQERVAEQALAVQREHGVATLAVAADLAQRNFMEQVRERTAGLEIGLLVCNAGVGSQGLFLQQDVEYMLRQIDVNCAAPLQLAHGFGRAMAARGRGGIVFVASGSGLQGSPVFASYAASKAYDLVLGEALWYELRAAGVDVLSFIPGPTNTPGLRSAHPGLREGVATARIKLPGPTAEAALRALGRGPVAARDAALARRIGRRRQAVESMGAQFLPGAATRAVQPVGDDDAT